MIFGKHGKMAIVQKTPRPCVPKHHACDCFLDQLTQMHIIFLVAKNATSGKKRDIKVLAREIAEYEKKEKEKPWHSVSR